MNDNILVENCSTCAKQYYCIDNWDENPKFEVFGCLNYERIEYNKDKEE